MQKVLVLAMSVALVGIAQAVTVNWDSTTGHNYTVGNAKGLQFRLDDLGMTSANGYAVSQINLMINSTSDWVTESDNQSHMNPVYVSLVYTTDNQVVSTGVKGKLYTEADIDAEDKAGGNIAYAGGSYAFLSFAFDEALTLKAGTDYQLLFYSDADCKTEMLGTLRGNTNTVLEHSGYLTEDSLAMYNGKPIAPNLQIRGEVLPEPTTLALLVLGVAGLALRRKVA